MIKHITSAVHPYIYIIFMIMYIPIPSLVHQLLEAQLHGYFGAKTEKVRMK